MFFGLLFGLVGDIESPSKLVPCRIRDLGGPVIDGYCERYEDGVVLYDGEMRPLAQITIHLDHSTGHWVVVKDILYFGREVKEVP